MRVVYYNLRVSRKHNVVLLVKLKGAPGVVVGQKWDLLLSGVFQEIGHWDCDQLNGCCERD